MYVRRHSDKLSGENQRVTLRTRPIPWFDMKIWGIL